MSKSNEHSDTVSDEQMWAALPWWGKVLLVALPVWIGWGMGLVLWAVFT